MNRGRRAKKRSRQNRSRKDGQIDEPTAESEMSVQASESLLGSRVAPQPDYREQYLFLLELFVNHVTSDRLAKLNQMFFVPTSITFRFLDFTEEDNIEVTPVDPMFQPQSGIADDIEYFFAGKSIMFAIDQDWATNKSLDLIIGLTVRKKMPDGVKPDILVGTGALDLSKHFAALRKEMLQCWHKMVAPPKCYEGDVPLMYNDNEIGAVSMYIRMSSFGQTVVTEFDSPPEKSVSTFVFKADESDQKELAYKCRIIDSKEGNICKDSKDDFFKGGAPCRICIKEEHPCGTCGHHAGATIKPRLETGTGMSVSQFPPTSRTISKPDNCADVQKPAGLIQTSRGPSQPCGKAVVLKVSGLLDDGKDKKPTVTVGSEADAMDPADPCDPEHDVFILRIGKKGLVGVGEKSDIQLEMRTPKGPERKPPLRYETREMQTEDCKGRRGRRGKRPRK